MRRSAPVVLAATLVALLACGRKDNPNPDPGINPDPNPGATGQGSATKRDTALTLGPGDLEITNEDSSVDMAVVGQKIVVRLSDKTMAKVRKETDTTAL
jgi:hypothetical protein